MPSDFASTLLLVLSCVVTFILSRVLSRKWREKRRQREEEARRAGESRQVRRARERRRPAR
jgi:flagellar biosynthesis/type III secretory pathway M-ring protein FliF/YscJ